MSAETGQSQRAGAVESIGALRATRVTDSRSVEQVVFTLDHPVDISALSKAWLKLLEQHPPLISTRFENDDENLQAATGDVDVVDWRGEPDERVRTDRLNDYLRKRRADEVRSPAFRLSLVRWDEASWRCVCELHSELLDWRSFSVILRELFAHYYAGIHGVAAPSRGARLVSSFANWLDATSSREVDEGFWREFLDRAPLPFRLDFPPVERADASDVDNCVECSLDVALSDSVRRLRKAADVTMNNLVQSAWALLLSRYAASNDVTFGIVRSCRHSLPPGVEDALGSFVNTVPFRLRIRGDANVFELLWQARDQYRRVREHECAPLQSVAQCVTGEAQPLFDTTLEFDLRDPMIALEEVFGSAGPHDFRHYSTASNGLHLQVYGEEELAFRLRYSPGLLDARTAARMLEQFRTLLVSMAREPWIAVKDLECLSEEDKAPCRWPAVQRLRSSGKARTIHGAFEDCVQRNPDTIAVRCADESLTYGELNARANRLALALRAAGASPDQLVGLCTERSIEQVVGIVGILKSGAAYLPLDPDYPADRLRFMLNDARTRLVVASDTASSRLPQGAFDVMTLNADDHGDDGNPEPRGGAKDLAYVIYTSGSTGQPKGVMVEHHNVVRLFDACESWLNPGIADVWTMFHSFAFDFSVWEIWGALLHGGRLEIVPPDIARSPDAFHDLLVERGVTVLNQTPSAFRQLARVNAERNAELPALRLVVFGGEKLDFTDLRGWVERHGDENPQLVNMYGITETTVHVTFRPVLRKDTEQSSVARIGCPLPDLYVRLLDAQGRPVPPGVRGEICVGGAGVSRGYLNQPRLTGERFVADPLDPEGDARLYRSGDYGRMMPNGELAYLGREDDQVKLRGFRIDLGEITYALRDIDGIEQAVAVARGSADAQRLLAYYVAEDDAALRAEDVRAALARRLPSWMLPSAFVPLKKMPVNANNKIDLKALPDPARTAADEQTEPPVTDSEKTLAAIWSDVLDRPSVGRRDDFFNLGGDSILAAKVVAAARGHGIRMLPRDVFNHPVLAELAQAVTERRDTDEEVDVMDARGALTPMQYWFFEQSFARPDHWNHSCLFRIPPDADIDALERAMLKVVERHDTLRTRFVRDDNGQWRAEKIEPSEALEFSRIELDHLDEAERREAISLITDDIQSSLSLSAGLLVRAAHFTGGVEEGDRLLIVLHQLAMDEASWEPLLQELDSAYRAFASNREPAFDDTPASCEAWVEELARYAHSASAAGEYGYWQRIVEAPVGAPFAAMLDEPGTEANARTVTLALEAPETAALLGDAHRAYGTSPAEIMLAGLSRALSDRWPECTNLRVDVVRHEHHGDGVDLSRAIGPLSTLQPLLLDQAVARNPARLLCEVKNRMRGAPRLGRGWSALRYLRTGKVSGSGRRSAPVLFDWLENRGRSAGSSMFQPLRDEVGRDRAPENRLAYPLEIAARRYDDQLVFTFRHDPATVPTHVVESLVQGFRQSLRQLIRHCKTREAVVRTPVDFPLARLTQEELDSFPLDLEHAEEVLPLSPIQRLYHALSGTDKDVGFDQWVFRLEGDIDEDVLDGAWNELCRRHDALRTVFVDSGLAEPHQVVLRNVTAHVQRMDWREFDAAACDQRLREFLAADQRRGFANGDVPLMRATLIRLAAREWILVWSHHQAIVDGWSWPVLAQELGELHDAGVEKRAPSLGPVGSYRSYIACLKERDLEEYSRFWRGHLGDVRRSRALITHRRRRHDGHAGVPDVRHFALTTQGALGDRLARLARKLRLTPSVVFQAAWALLLAGLTRRFDVTMGVAFSGRTSALPVPEHTVGSFVNDLPVHLKVQPTERIDRWLSGMRGLQADLNHYQNVSPLEVHQWAGIAPGERLFDSLVVFQNYATGTAARQWGSHIKVRSFDAGVRTNYPLTVAVTPGQDLRVDFFHDAAAIDKDTVRVLAGDLHTILVAIADNPDIHLATVINHVSEAPVHAGRPVLVASDHRLARRESDRAAADVDAGDARDGLHDELEETVAGVCRDVLGADEFDSERNFFDAGAQSVTLIEIHRRLQDALDRRFPIVTLFQHPSVNALARYLRGPAGAVSSATGRGAQQRAALARRRQARQPGNLER